MPNSHRRVLLVEDDKSYALLLSVLMRAPLLEIVIVNTFVEAMGWLKRKLPIYAVVLDVHLPDATVSEVLESIPSFKEAGAAAVVVITGMARVEGFPEHAMELGASLCLMKDEAGFVEKLCASVSPVRA
jgi:ActR/RegA family two-component response regulator